MKIKQNHIGIRENKKNDKILIKNVLNGQKVNIARKGGKGRREGRVMTGDSFF